MLRSPHTKEAHDTWTSCYLGTSPRSGQRTRLQEPSCQLTKPEASRSDACGIACDRPGVQFASTEISRAMGQPTINADETLKGLARCYLTAPRLLWCFLATAQALQDRRTQCCELGSMPCDSEELRVHTRNAGETPDLCWNHDASCDLFVVRRKRVLRCSAWSMQNCETGGTDVGFGLQYAS